LKHPNKILFARRNDLGYLEDIREKLLFSGIGIYQPETFQFQQMQNFLEKKDLFNGILSNSAIVYGTNISLSIVDIDRSFIKDSTKNVLYQLVGRAGRIGKSNSATIVFRDNTILQMILNENDINQEALQVEKNYLEIMNC
jgi:NDP-sugar pyrophosphorylase family protein